MLCSTDLARPSATLCLTRPYATSAHTPRLSTLRAVDHNGFACGVSISDQDKLPTLKKLLANNPYVKTAAEVDAKWTTLKYLYYPNPFGVHPVLTGPEHGMYALHNYGEWGP